MCILPYSIATLRAQTWSRHLPTSDLSGIITYDFQYTVLLVVPAFPRQGSSHPQSFDVLLAETFPVAAAHRKCSPAGCIHEAPWNTQFHSFIAENLPMLTGPAKSLLTDFACKIPFSAKDLRTGLQSTQFCGCNETLQLLPRIWKTGNMVTLKFLQQLSPYPALTTPHLIAKWQKTFPFPSIKSCAVPKANGTKS